MSSKLLSLSETKERFGEQFLSLKFVLGEKLIKKISEKFKGLDEGILYGATLEVVRYLFLASYSEESVFFPGTQLVDDIWHALIIETELYRQLCSRIRYGKFVDHTGIIYEDYCSTSNPTKIIEEQFSWAASYVSNFGKFTESSYLFLPLASQLAESLKKDREELNVFLEEVIREQSSNSSRTDWRQLLDNCVRPQRSAIDEDVYLLRSIFRSLLRSTSSPLTNEILQRFFYESTALGFLAWQHCAAVERLDRAELTTNETIILVQKAKRGEVLVGLGTTHLNRSVPTIDALPLGDSEFILNGFIPWTSGYEMFDYLVVGFKHLAETFFAVVPFPSSGNPLEGMTVTRHQMRCLNSTSSVRIDLKNVKINVGSIIERYNSNNSKNSALSEYRLPEMGIAQRAIEEVLAWTDKASGEKKEVILRAVKLLKTRFDQIVVERNSTKSPSDLVSLMPQKDILVRDAVSLLKLSTSGGGMLYGALASSLTCETQLLDAVIQPMSSIEAKCAEISGRYLSQLA